MQDIDADIQKAKLESHGRLAAVRKQLLAAEDVERAELEREYRQASELAPATIANAVTVSTLVVCHCRGLSVQSEEHIPETPDNDVLPMHGKSG